MKRDAEPIRLTSNVLRRTYTTRQLYRGRSVYALQRQLGHTSIRTTILYAKQDLFEHPARVVESLDAYARSVLLLWSRPLLLEGLNPDEMAAIVTAKRERDQQVGLCRYSTCVKAERGNPPPCSLCEHLATGEEFLQAWETEFNWRRRELNRLCYTNGATHLTVQAAYQLEHFTANYQYVTDSLADRCVEDGRGNHVDG